MKWFCILVFVVGVASCCEHVKRVEECNKAGGVLVMAYRSDLCLAPGAVVKP